MTTREDIVRIARGFIGTRFVHQGRGQGGLDCLGLLLAVAQAASLEFDATLALQSRHYGRLPDTELLQAKLHEFLWPREPAAILPADILLLHIDGRPQHLAIVSDYPAMGELGIIHAYAGAHGVVEHRLDAHWKQAICGAYTLPQLLTR